MTTASNLTATTSSRGREDGGLSPLSASQTSSAGGAPRPGVMARLHALFPTSPSAMHDHPLPSGLPSTAPNSKAHSPPKFIKIRISTWNMYDSIPKGDLQELLGTVYPTELSYPPGEPALSSLAADANHPYHLVVVAGQECPTVSGLPRGLGAPGFQRKERDLEKEKEKVKEKARGKEKDREKDKDKDRDEERESGEQPLLPRPPQVQSQPKERDKDAEDRIHPRSLHKFHLHRDHSQHKHSKEDLGLLDALASPLMPDHNHNFAYGWSAMLEEWHCHGGPPPPVHPNPSTSQLQGLNNNSKPPLLDVPISDEECMIPPKAKSTGDLALRMTPTVAEKGPYELLVKERMMGIYLAVFINRDIKGLVRGTSKGVVTAGLIGGRVGNKGAVGISLNIDGTTFLFVNAHLAAHEGKVHHRLANLAKIKSELVVDDFLESDDPRFMAEDLTDRFDHTFIFGDLNFRLDVTRLHADWLISRREYAQALAFDQLSKVMKEGTALSGFAEAPIDFPPTFKYDVLPSLKRRKTHSRSYKYFPKTPTTAVPGTPQHAKMLTGVEEEKSKFRHEHERREEEKERDSAEGDDRSADSAEGEGDGQGEAASLASTTWTSAASRYTSDLEDRERDFRESQEEEYFSSRPSISLSSLSRDQGSASPTFSANTMANTNNNANMNGLASPGNLVHKMWTAAAAHKAKSKFVSLLTSSPAPGTPKGKWGRPKKGFLGGNKNGLHLDLHLHPHGEASAPNSPMALTPGFASPGPGSGWTPTPTPGFQTTTFPPTPGPSGVGSEDSDDVGGPREGEHDEKYLKASRSAVSSTEILRKNSAISSKSARRSEDKERGKDQEKDNSPQDVAEDDKGVYDSSHKKRVPSWCDRILFKSAVLDESESESEEEELPPVPARTGMGRLLQALNLRTRKDSYTSTSSIDATSKDPTSSFASDGDGPSDHGHHVVSPPRTHGYRPNRSPPRRFSFSRSTDSLPLPSELSNPSRSHTQFLIPVEPRSRSRKHSVPPGPTIQSASATTRSFSIPPPLSHSAQSHRMHETTSSPLLDHRDNLTPPVIPKDHQQSPLSPPRWLNFALRPFTSSKDVSPVPVPLEESETEPIPAPPPRKGDVVCLNYDTLDDRAMKRLEGRSDHRPVIGSYAVYI